ncbi:MAG: GDP-4-dehydro-6-deoxy-D-mannose reductase [Thermoleophilaceae bacterium]|nr:GDP-4-dehydro-6-deoxy-D-mannose reductase [Thermoleophilaceae bacterium]
MRVLITGGTGFVGGFLTSLALARGADVVTLGRRASPPDAEARHVRADLGDQEALASAVRAAEPDVVFHLAARASVAESWAHPRATIGGNVDATLNLLEAVRLECPGALVLTAGSGEAYGPVPAERLPITEGELLRPQNPYAVSKASADLLAGFYADAHGLRVVRTRAFNHAGPRQTDAYVIAAFARQIAEAERAGERELVLATGDLRPRRDFTDVRDVVDAYWLLAQRGEPGVFNVCSGVSVAVADILATLAGLTELDVEQRTDPSRLRRREVMEIRGSHDKLTDATGWKPRTPLRDTLRDTLDWWRASG